jgi:hypothetical protein
VGRQRFSTLLVFPGSGLLCWAGATRCWSDGRKGM